MPPTRPGSQGGAASLTLQQALQRAVEALGRGDTAEVEALCRRILAAQPAHFEALYLLGIAAGREGRAQHAVDFLSQCLRANGGHADAHYNLGVALAALGRHDEAVESYERAIALNPAHGDALFNHGSSLAALGRHDGAERSCRRALAIEPGSAPVLHNLGVALAKLGRFAEALDCYDRAIAIKPDYPSAYNNRGAALAAMLRMEEALASYERAIALRPEYAVAYNNRGIALWALERHAEAVASCERAIALEPGYADAHCNRGNALRELQRHEEAAASYERAIALDPGNASAHWNLADSLLLQGDFARGWREYEWRWKLGNGSRAKREFDRPLWRGDESIAGRTILLHAELGLGDTLQFCRYAAEVARLGARVVLEVQPELAPLLRSVEGVDEIVAAGGRLPRFDAHCPLMSLPLAFKSHLGSIPAAVPYVRSDPERAAAWRARLGPGRGPRVGIVWSGSRGLANDKRSMALAQMLPLARDGAQWVSLQREVSEADAAWLALRDDMRHFGGELRDFADTAALVELMDLVLTVDTSVAHLAGAMGKPVWILLPHVPHDWRWLLDRDDSVWYPTARLFRQRTAGDWDGVVRWVSVELRRYLVAAA